MRSVVAPILTFLLLLCASALPADNAQALSGPARQAKCESRKDDGNISIERMSAVENGLVVPQLLTKKCVCGRWVDVSFMEFGSLCGSDTWVSYHQSSYRPIEVGKECFPFEERATIVHRYDQVVCSDTSASSSSGSPSSGSTLSPGTRKTKNATLEKCAIGTEKTEYLIKPVIVHVPGAPPRLDISDESVDSVDTRPISSINPETGQCEVGWEDVPIEAEPV